MILMEHSQKLVYLDAMMRNRDIRDARARHRAGTAAIALLVLVSWPLSAAADIYKFVDKYGRVFLTDRPDHPGYRLLVKTWKGWTEKTPSGDYRKNQERFAPHIATLAQQYEMPKALLHAVITAESWYNPTAVSTAGAVGLMQLMPGTAERYGVVNRSDPVANLRGGTRYLRDLLDLFDNNLVLALAAYNAGENAVIRNNYQVPDYPETRDYVKKVLRYYRDYRKVM